MLGQQAIAQIARHTKLTRQTIYRIKDDSAGAGAAFGSLGIVGLPTHPMGRRNIGAEGILKSQQDSPPPGSCADATSRQWLR
jgi:Helix-turn-helix domain of resolvase